MFLIEILSLLIVLSILMVVNYSITKFSIPWTTKVVIKDSSHLILPTFLISLSWLLVTLLWSIVIYIISGYTITEYMINLMLGANINGSLDTFSTFLITVGFIICGIILQAFCYLAINKKANVANNINDYDNPEKKEMTKITINNSLFTSLFSFSLVFFFVLIFLVIGIIIGNLII